MLCQRKGPTKTCAVLTNTKITSAEVNPKMGTLIKKTFRKKLMFLPIFILFVSFFNRWIVTNNVICALLHYD